MAEKYIIFIGIYIYIFNFELVFFAEMGLLDPMVDLCLIKFFFPIVAVPVYLSTSSASELPFVHLLINTCCLLSFL